MAYSLPQNSALDFESSPDEIVSPTLTYFYLSELLPGIRDSDKLLFNPSLLSKNLSRSTNLTFIREVSGEGPTSGTFDTSTEDVSSAMPGYFGFEGTFDTAAEDVDFLFQGSHDIGVIITPITADLVADFQGLFYPIGDLLSTTDDISTIFDGVVLIEGSLEVTTETHVAAFDGIVPEPVDGTADFSTNDVAVSILAQIEVAGDWESTVTDDAFLSYGIGHVVSEDADFATVSFTGVFLAVTAEDSSGPLTVTTDDVIPSVFGRGHIVGNFVTSLPGISSRDVDEDLDPTSPFGILLIGVTTVEGTIAFTPPGLIPDITGETPLDLQATLEIFPSDCEGDFSGEVSSGGELDALAEDLVPIVLGAHVNAFLVDLQPEEPAVVFEGFLTVDGVFSRTLDSVLCEIDAHAVELVYGIITPNEPLLHNIYLYFGGIISLEGTWASTTGRDQFQTIGVNIYGVLDRTLTLNYIDFIGETGPPLSGTFDTSLSDFTMQSSGYTLLEATFDTTLLGIRNSYINGQVPLEYEADVYSVLHNASGYFNTYHSTAITGFLEVTLPNNVSDTGGWTLLDFELDLLTDAALFFSTGTTPEAVSGTFENFPFLTFMAFEGWVPLLGGMLFGTESVTPDLQAVHHVGELVVANTPELIPNIELFVIPGIDGTFANVEDFEMEFFGEARVQITAELVPVTSVAAYFNTYHPPSPYPVYGPFDNTLEEIQGNIYVDSFVVYGTIESLFTDLLPIFTGRVLIGETFAAQTGKLQSVITGKFVGEQGFIEASTPNATSEFIVIGKIAGGFIITTESLKSDIAMVRREDGWLQSTTESIELRSLFINPDVIYGNFYATLQNLQKVEWFTIAPYPIVGGLGTPDDPAELFGAYGYFQLYADPAGFIETTTEIIRTFQFIGTVTTGSISATTPNLEAAIELLVPEAVSFNLDIILRSATASLSGDGSRGGPLLSSTEGVNFNSFGWTLIFGAWVGGDRAPRPGEPQYPPNSGDVGLKQYWTLKYAEADIEGAVPINVEGVWNTNLSMGASPEELAQADFEGLVDIYAWMDILLKPVLRDITGFGVFWYEGVIDPSFPLDDVTMEFEGTVPYAVAEDVIMYLANATMDSLVQGMIESIMNMRVDNITLDFDGLAAYHDFGTMPIVTVPVLTVMDGELNLDYRGGTAFHYETPYVVGDFVGDVAVFATCTPKTTNSIMVSYASHNVSLGVWVTELRNVVTRFNGEYLAASGGFFYSSSQDATFTTVSWVQLSGLFRPTLQNLQPDIEIEVPIPIYAYVYIYTDNVIPTIDAIQPPTGNLISVTAGCVGNINAQYIEPITATVSTLPYATFDALAWVVAQINWSSPLQRVTPSFEGFQGAYAELMDITLEDTVCAVKGRGEHFTLPQPTTQRLYEVAGRSDCTAKIRLYEKITNRLVDEVDTRLYDNGERWFLFEQVPAGEYYVISVPKKKHSKLLYDLIVE